MIKPTFGWVMLVKTQIIKNVIRNKRMISERFIGASILES